MKRFTRLTIGFSRKVENVEATVDLHMAYFNFCWRPGTMKVTPAQAAGIADHCWSFRTPAERSQETRDWAEGNHEIHELHESGRVRFAADELDVAGARGSTIRV